jgi:hypothetical protein
LPHQVNQKLSAAEFLYGKDQPRHRTMVADANARNSVEIAQQSPPINGDPGRLHGLFARATVEIHGGILPGLIRAKKATRER